MRILVTLICLFSPGSLLLARQVLEVCSTCTVRTLCEAVEMVQPGGEIRLHEGHYREGQIVINKPLTIIGVNSPVLDGERQVEVLTITSDSVTIEGLTIINSGQSYIKEMAGIRVSHCKYFTLKNNRIENTMFAIYLAYATNGIISGNQLKSVALDEASSGNGVHAWYCKNILIENNKVQGHRDGIYFEFVDSSLIEKNESFGNLRYGLHFMFSNHDRYTDNIFRNNGSGVAVMFSKFIDMHANRFEHNWGAASYGLLLKEIYDAEIFNNIFFENSTGITLEGSTRINYYNNNFESNGWAVVMSGGCLENKFYDNNFLYNTMDLVVNSQVNDNTFDGNYWSEYSGYDLDRDGGGDVPFRPVKLFGFILSRSPEAVVLLRSLFIDLLNLSERVSPVFTPAQVIDHQPKMMPVS